MSKIIASAAIRGAYKIVENAEKKWQEAMDKWGANEPVGFPNTAYYLPIIYGILGEKVEKLGDMESILKRCRSLLPPPVRELHPLPYLAPALDAGMATFFAEECIEAIRYLEDPNFYLLGEDVTDDNIWLGAADDVIMGDIGDNMFVGADACRQNLRYGCIGNYWEAPVNRPGGVGVPFVGYVNPGISERY